MSVTYHESESKSLLMRRGITDSWFVSRYSMNLYRGCQHGCVYCDGRAERYYVKGDFERDITVKTNALDLLDRELSRLREPGFVFLGGGVCDAYQPAESKYELARGALKLVRAAGLPVHILTKSALVKRDFDLLKPINQDSRVILSFSIQTLDDDLRRTFEPGAAPIEARFNLLKKAKKLGMSTGIYALPVLPGLSDQPEAIDRLVERGAQVGVDFIAFGGLTLRPVIQKQGYFEVIENQYPDLLMGYERIFRDQLSSGRPDSRYLARVDQRFHDAIIKHQVPGRIPRHIFTGLIPRYTEAAILLEHHDFERQVTGQTTFRLGRAGFAIQEWARKLIGKRGRRKSFRFQQIEDEFLEMVNDGSILQLSGMTRTALSFIEKMF